MRRVFLSLLLLTAIFAAAAGPALAGTTGTFCADSEEMAFLAKINAYRAKKGKPKLAFTQPLGAAADHHSVDMANKNYFSHTLKGGVSWWQNMKDHGYNGQSGAENIAAGNASAAGTFTQWKNSPDHNRNMLNGSFRAIGIGRAYNANSKYGWYWTTVFGESVQATATTC